MVYFGIEIITSILTNLAVDKKEKMFIKIKRESKIVKLSILIRHWKNAKTLKKDQIQRPSNVTFFLILTTDI